MHQDVSNGVSDKCVIVTVYVFGEHLVQMLYVFRQFLFTNHHRSEPRKRKLDIYLHLKCQDSTQALYQGLFVYSLKVLLFKRRTFSILCNLRRKLFNVEEKHVFSLLL